MATADTSELYRTPIEIARELRLDPSAPVRWLKKGVLMSDGSRLRLRHLCVPGGYRVKQEWLDEFFQAIADDRAGRGKLNRTPPVKSARVLKMDAELKAAGLL